MRLKALFLFLKVLVFESNSFVCGKNEDIGHFYDCTWKRMWLKALLLFQKFNNNYFIITNFITNIITIL